MDPIIEKLFSLGLPIGGPIVWFLCLFAFGFSPYNRLWTEERSGERKRIIGELMQLSPRNRLRRSLTRRLDWLDARLSSHEVAAGRGPWRVAFSWDLLGLAILSAVAYPLLAALLQWLAGLPIRFGETELVAASDWQARLLPAFSIGISACLCLFFLKSKSWLRWPSLSAASIFVSLIPSLSAWLGLEIPSAFAFAVAMAGVIAGAGVLLLPLRIEVALVVASTVALVVAGTVALAGVVAFAGAAAFVGKISIAGTVVFAFVVAVAVTAGSTDEFMERRNKRHPGFRLLMLLFLLALLSAALRLRPLMTDAPPSDFDIYLILMFGLFPLLNALADFASTGLTRLLLRAGLAQMEGDGIALRRRAVWLWLLDLLGGLAAFAALGCAAIAWIHFARPPQGPLLDLPALFTGLEARPGEYWWLGAMLITTLLPTLLHIAMGLGALLRSPPEFIRAPIVKALDAGEDHMSQRIFGTMGFCALQTVALWAPFWIGLLIWRFEHEAIIAALRGFFAWFARMIGAL